MKRLIEPLLLLPAAGFALPVLIDSALKGVLLMALTLLAAILLRHSTAALRHLILVSAMGGLLLLPILSITLPSWRILPTWSQKNPAPIEKTTPPNNPAVATISDFIPIINTTTLTDESLTKTKTIPWAQIAIWTWLIGATTLTLRLTLSQYALWRLDRKATALPSQALQQTLTELRFFLQIQRPVHLILHPDRAMPMTWGILKTRLLLPADSTTWTAERTRAVLIHELAHVKRRDCLTQLLVQATTAIHWFNPLVWIAARQVAAERERACDDLVLNSGIRPSDYAEHLLRIATSYEDKPIAGAAALAMARKSRLEGRLTSILNRSTDRRTLSRRATFCAIAALALIATPVAMMRAVAQEKGEKSLEEVITNGAEENLDQPSNEKNLVNIIPEETANKIREKLWLSLEPDADPIGIFDWIKPVKANSYKYIQSRPADSNPLIQTFRQRNYVDYNFVDPLRNRPIPTAIDPVLLPERTSIGSDVGRLPSAPAGTITWTQPKTPKIIQAHGKLIDPWGNTFIVAQDPPQPPAGAAIQSAPKKSNPSEQLAARRQRLAELRASGLGEGHPKIKAAKAEIKNFIDHILANPHLLTHKPTPANLQLEIEERTATKKRLEDSGYGNQHPKILRLEIQIERLKNQLLAARQPPQQKLPDPVLISLKNADATKAKSSIDALLKDSKRGKVIAEPQTNSLIYTGDQETLDLVRTMVQWLEEKK